MGLITIDDDDFYLNAQMLNPLLLRYAKSNGLTLGFIEIPKFLIVWHHHRIPRMDTVVEYNGKLYSVLLYNYECDVFLISNSILSFKEADDMGIDVDLHRQKCDYEIYDEPERGLRWFRERNKPSTFSNPPNLIDKPKDDKVYCFTFRKANRTGSYVGHEVYDDHYPHHLMGKRWYRTATGRGTILNDF